MNKDRRPLPRPRLGHPFDQFEAGGENELSPATVAALGELAATDPNQIRLRSMVKNAEVAARLQREASGDASATEVEFEAKSGEQLAAKSPAVAEAANVLGISEDVQVTLTYAFPSDQGPTGITLELINEATEDYTLVSIAEAPRTAESEGELYVGVMETEIDESTLTSEEEIRQAAASAPGGDIIEELAEFMEGEPSASRPLESGELEATAIIGQALLDLQHPPSAQPK